MVAKKSSASSANSASIFAAAPGSTRDAASVTQIGKVDLPSSYTSLVSFHLGDGAYIGGYGPSKATLDLFEVSAKSPWLKPVKAGPEIGTGKDILNVFVLGDRPHICAYTKKNGVFETYSFADDLTFTTKAPYKFYRNHELATSQNFSTVKFFTQFSAWAGQQVVFIGYRDDTGYVGMYTAGLAATATSAGVPSILMLPVWSHTWAPGWTRFAFFNLGGEAFFLKTNTKKLNVNIDHVQDTLASGTLEVGTQLQSQLPDAANLTHVEPLIFTNGEPWFVTYKASSGDATVNRIHGDCLGWTQGASFKAPAAAANVTSIAADGQTLVIFA
jgi:hypothetical protein